MSGIGIASQWSSFASRRARAIISNRSAAVNGFSRVYDSPALPIPRMRSSCGRAFVTCRTTSTCPEWNGWNRPTRSPRTCAPLLRREVLDVVDELVDVRARRRQVVPAVAARLVVQVRLQRRVEDVTRAVAEPVLPFVGVGRL